MRKPLPPRDSDAYKGTWAPLTWRLRPEEVFARRNSGPHQLFMAAKRERKSLPQDQSKAEDYRS